MAWRRQGTDSCRPFRARHICDCILTKGLRPWLLTSAPTGLILVWESVPRGPHAKYGGRSRVDELLVLRTRLADMYHWFDVALERSAGYFGEE